MSTKAKKSGGKGLGSKRYITRSIPVNAVIVCADNTGAKTLRVVQVKGWKGRLRR